MRIVKSKVGIILSYKGGGENVIDEIKKNVGKSIKK